MNEEPEYISERGDQWVSIVIDFARHSKPLVADGVLAKMELLLKGRMVNGGGTFATAPAWRHRNLHHWRLYR